MRLRDEANTSVPRDPFAPPAGPVYGDPSATAPLARSAPLARPSTGAPFARPGRLPRSTPVAPALRGAGTLLVLALALAWPVAPGGPAALQGQAPTQGQTPTRAAVGISPPSFTLAEILAPAFAYDLVSARDADRIAWLVNEAGRRGIYTAAAPDFAPLLLLQGQEDDGVDLSGLQISGDGSVVTFIRGHAANGEGWVANPSSDADGGAREVWALSTRGGAPWRVAEVADYTLSPDGAWILHVRDGEVWREPVAGAGGAGASSAIRPAAPLFRTHGRNGSPAWSPDGRRIAFVSDRESHSFIGVYHVGEHRVVYLAPGVDRDSAPAWSPDGREVAFIRRPGAAFGAQARLGAGLQPDALPTGFMAGELPGGSHLSLWRVDVESGEGRAFWAQPAGDPRFRDIQELHWGAGHVVFESEPGNWRHWFSVALEAPAAEPLPLTPGEGFVEMVDLSSDGRFLYFSSNIGDIDRRNLWRAPVGGGAPQQLTTSEGIETFPAALASGSQVAVLSAGVRQPQSVALVPASGGAPRVLGPPLPAAFPGDRHVVPTNVVLESPDGLRFNNQLFLPPGLRPGERRPALIFLHGGPARQMLLGYNYGHFYHMAYAVNQYFANKGYVVLSVNYRRGIGYGKEFRTAPNTRHQGMEEYQDVRAAGEYLRARDDVDAGRVALWGLSYGGTLTAQGLARNSDLFAAGIDIAGVHFFTEPRDVPLEVVDTTTVAFRSSSAPLVEDWTSPILLVHGDDDRNVPFFQTVGMVQLLRAHEVPHELIVFPDDVHSFLLHHRWLQTFEAMDEFLDRRMIRGGEGAGAR